MEQERLNNSGDLLIGIPTSAPRKKVNQNLVLRIRKPPVLDPLPHLEDGACLTFTREVCMCTSVNSEDVEVIRDSHGRPKKFHLHNNSKQPCSCSAPLGDTVKHIFDGRSYHRHLDGKHNGNPCTCEVAVGPTIEQLPDRPQIYHRHHNITRSKRLTQMINGEPVLNPVGTSQTRAAPQLHEIMVTRKRKGQRPTNKPPPGEPALIQYGPLKRRGHPDGVGPLFKGSHGWITLPTLKKMLKAADISTAKEEALIATIGILESLATGLVERAITFAAHRYTGAAVTVKPSDVEHAAELMGRKLMMGPNFPKYKPRKRKLKRGAGANSSGASKRVKSGRAPAVREVDSDHESEGEEYTDGDAVHDRVVDSDDSKDDESDQDQAIEDHESEEHQAIPQGGKRGARGAQKMALEAAEDGEDDDDDE
jgi:histone H3/H4